VMRTFDDDMAARIEAAMAAHGVAVRTNLAVEAFEPGQVHTAQGPIAADLVVLGLGVVPNAEVALEAGVGRGERGAIRVDRRGRTDAEGVWAAGDCADTYHRVTGRRLHVALGTVANRTGRVVGVNVAGGYATFPGVVGTAVSRICSTEVGRTGLSAAEAATAGFEVVAVVVESTTRAGYFPGAAPIAVKLLAERGTGRLLGGQVVGGEGAAKRVDVVATAITAGMTVEEVVDLDFGYAPPMSPVWDPVATAARALARKA
jgi:NADPH-dependent 2,4-dienoyl-CoA reductase/sulfur reductase-like enzyme